MFKTYRVTSVLTLNTILLDQTKLKQVGKEFHWKIALLVWPFFAIESYYRYKIYRVISKSAKNNWQYFSDF